MRSTGSGPMGALLMLAPLVAVPILAVVGIPQFAPGNLIDVNGPKSTAIVRDNRESSAPAFGDDARHDADDLFAPLEESDTDVNGFEDPLGRRKSGSRGRNSRFESDDQLENTAGRGRRGLRSSVDELFEQDPEADADLGEEFTNNDDQFSGRRGGNRRPTNKRAADEFAEEENSATPFDEFEGQGRARQQPAGDQFADASGDFGDGQLPANSRTKPRREQESEFAEPESLKRRNVPEGNPFEAPPAASANSSKKRPPARGRDARDAPPFQPEESGAEAYADSGAGFEPPPAPKAAKTAPRTAPRSRPPVIPAELPAGVEELGSGSETTDSQQMAGIDELTWQAATERLRTLGVGKGKHYFTYVEDTNLFLFTCSAIHSQDSKKSGRFQAEAEEPLLAVRQVLEKLEAWQSVAGKRRAAAE